MTQAEISFLQYLEGWRNGFTEALFEGITMLGEETILILLIAVLYFAYDKNLARRIIYIVVVSQCVNGIVKNMVKRPRPFANGEVTTVRENTATGYSFPSGHTQTFATWTTTFAMMFKKKWVWGIALLGTVLVAFSRLFLGVHYPTDVIAGALLGIGIAIGLSVIYEKTENKQKLYGITLLVLSFFAVIFMIKPDSMYGDFFKIYGMMLGLTVSLPMEEKYGRLTYDVPVMKKVLRIIIGVVAAVAIKEGVKLIDVSFSLHLTLLLNTIRYALLVITAFGFCPILFKRIKL